MHLHQCISYRYDDGSTDQLKDDWESEDGVMVLSLGKYKSWKGKMVTGQGYGLGIGGCKRLCLVANRA